MDHTLSLAALRHHPYGQAAYLAISDLRRVVANVVGQLFSFPLKLLKSHSFTGGLWQPVGELNPSSQVENLVS